MIRWIAFLLMTIGLGIAFFTSTMSIINRILALCLFCGFGIFAWYQSDKDHTKKE